ncbi:hypothetical protein [Streptacidiphilus cavernicola]|uniref:DUF3558 domain-containing protein n=1 Tax=Streptacidiphilus cavernicola TaxID=3342716 RepID=A0ABV6VYS9_9ACTN
MNARQILCHRGAVAATAAVLVALGAAGCSSSGPTAATTAATATQSDGPSDAAHIVCTDTARNEITGALGIDTTEPLAPTWTDHTYACRYAFADGSMLLSVKDLTDAAATTAWFDSLRAAATGSTPLSGMGDGAFQQPDGDVVVRKDDAVLVVDVTALPANVGKPVRPRAVAARTVAQTVMICWKEYG